MDHLVSIIPSKKKHCKNGYRLSKKNSKQALCTKRFFVVNQLEEQHVQMKIKQNKQNGSAINDYTMLS